MPVHSNFAKTNTFQNPNYPMEAPLSGGDRAVIIMDDCGEMPVERAGGTAFTASFAVAR
jgi:hypothetical protein